MKLIFYQVEVKSCVNNVVFEIPQLFAQIKQSAQFEDRNKAVVTHNRANKWTKPLDVEHELEQLFDGCSCHAYVDGAVHVIKLGLEIDDTSRPDVLVVVSWSQDNVCFVFKAAVLWTVDPRRLRHAHKLGQLEFLQVAACSRGKVVGGKSFVFSSCLLCARVVSAD